MEGKGSRILDSRIKALARSRMSRIQDELLVRKLTKCKVISKAPSSMQGRAWKIKGW